MERSHFGGELLLADSLLGSPPLTGLNPMVYVRVVEGNENTVEGPGPFLEDLAGRRNTAWPWTDQADSFPVSQSPDTGHS